MGLRAGLGAPPDSEVPLKSLRAGTENGADPAAEAGSECLATFAAPLARTGPARTAFRALLVAPCRTLMILMGTVTPTVGMASDMRPARAIAKLGTLAAVGGWLLWMEAAIGFEGLYAFAGLAR